MNKFKKHNYNFENSMDPEVIDLCDAINSLPGLETIESCCGHGASPFSIWFRVKDSKEGLFFLTRCIDRRYWENGYLWGIELYVGDMFKDNHLPITYHLHSGPIVGDLAYKQAESLIENMNHHLNHEGFLKGFKLDLSKFEIEKS